MDGWDETELFQESASYGDVEVVKRFINEGIDLNSPLDEDGTTILMIAAGEGQLEIVKLLVERGADVNILSEGNSPLISAICGRHKDKACSKRGMSKVAAFLELFGAKPSPKIILGNSQQTINTNYY
jgi:hypothetical protein